MERRQFRYYARYTKIFIFAAIVVTLVFAVNQIKFSRLFPIKTVRIYGANKVDHLEVQELLLPMVKSGYFNINIEYIRDRLLQIPWVSHLHVRRIWPDQVEVMIVEKHAAALWHEDGNSHSLLSQAGELFLPKHDTYPTHLPRFNGPAGKQVVMLRFFNDINRLLNPLHTKVSYLELTPYLVWKISLDNGMTLQVGHKDILTRLDQFVKVYPKIVGNKVSDVDYVDLRYPNGLAIKWKAPLLKT